MYTQQTLTQTAEEMALSSSQSLLKYGQGEKIEHNQAVSQIPLTTPLGSLHSQPYPVTHSSNSFFALL